MSDSDRFGPDELGQKARAERRNTLETIERAESRVAHDINNRLAIVNEAAGLLQDLVTLSDEPLSRDQAKKIVDAIQQAVKDGQVITKRLIRPADPRPVNIDIGELIQEVATWHKETGGEREILFDPALAAGLPPISIAPGMLKLVLSNTIHHLMSNSSGGVLIRLKSEDEAIMILCSSRSAEPGVGIRSGPDTARVGADPGLPLSAELVAQLGGEMGTDDRGNVWVRLLRETSD